MGRAPRSVYSPIWAVAMTWRTRNHVRAGPPFPSAGLVSMVAKPLLGNAEDACRSGWLQIRTATGFISLPLDTDGAAIKDEASPGGNQKFAACGDQQGCQSIHLKWR